MYIKSLFTLYCAKCTYIDMHLTSICSVLHFYACWHTLLCHPLRSVRSLETVKILTIYFYIFSFSFVVFTYVPVLCIALNTDRLHFDAAHCNTHAHNIVVWKRHIEKHCFLCALSVTCIDPVLKNIGHSTWCERALKVYIYALMNHI